MAANLWQSPDKIKTFGTECIKGQMSLAQKFCPRINLCIVRLEGCKEHRAD